jgi:hypothetical protein
MLRRAMTAPPLQVQQQLLQASHLLMLQHRAAPCVLRLVQQVLLLSCQMQSGRG